jgi:hypothetical protein
MQPGMAGAFDAVGQQRIMGMIAATTAQTMPERSGLRFSHSTTQVAMDMGWITTFASDTAATPQISVATEGGSGTAVPDLSVQSPICEHSD